MSQRATPVMVCLKPPFPFRKLADMSPSLRYATGVLMVTQIPISARCILTLQLSAEVIAQMIVASEKKDDWNPPEWFPEWYLTPESTLRRTASATP